MFSFVLRKLFHKKWMALCLLIGNILLVSVAASYPLYRVSSFQRMLVDEFRRYAKEENHNPAVFQVSYHTMKGGAAIGFAAVEEETFAAAENLGVDILETVTSYELGTRKAFPSIVRDGEDEKRITLGAVSGMEEHVELLYGHFPKNVPDDDGCLEVMVSDEAMIEQDMLLSDEYLYDGLELVSGEPLKLKVVGIFRVPDGTENYWEAAETDIAKQVYTSAGLFRNTFLGKDVENQYTLSGRWNFVWDYEKLKPSDVNALVRTTQNLNRTEILKDKVSDGGYLKILNTYTAKARRIEVTLLILQVPVLMLLCAFLYMISGQMLQMEQNEISILRSRGASKRQIVALYLMQSISLSVSSVLAGVPLGTLFCKMLGSATAFLAFSSARSLPVRFAADVIPYTLGAVLLSVAVTTMPVLSYSELSIVNVKRSRARGQKSLWKRMYLDVILVAVALYGWYSFNRSQNTVTMEVLSGNALDPLLYISFSLFILGSGLLCVRLQPLFLKGIFALGAKRMKPSTYASLLGAVRGGAKQEFIIIFLILTVSIGISDTTIARSIVLNAVNNTAHLVGADVVVKEKWADNAAAVLRGSVQELNYTEPDFEKYQTIPGVEEATPVIYIDDGKVSGTTRLSTDIMGIRTAGFYEVTNLQEGLLPYTYAEYLNALSADPSAVLLSENYMHKQGYRLGDSIAYERADGAKAVGTVYGFFAFWPGYEPEAYSVTEVGEAQREDNYLIVANYSRLVDTWGVYPYEVWMNTTDGGEGIREWISEHPELKWTKFEMMAEKEKEIIQDTMFQGTNGILSMSFIVILLLCLVGYLIYWILSIRSRELLFGVLRAMGMKKREITWLLIVEQMCTGLYAVVCGAAIGVFSSTMFVPMIQQAYAASEQVLPLHLITKATDLLQLFAVIVVMLVICLFILGRIVSGMNISTALKLGED